MRAGNQSGQILLISIIVASLTALLVTPVFNHISTMVQKSGNEREQRMKVAANEAAISLVVADLVRGADAIPTTYTTTEPHAGGTFPTFTINTFYTPQSVTVNGYSPTVSITAPSVSQTKPATQQNYIDPGITHPNLATVLPGEAYLMRIYNMKPGTLQVNWAYSPAGSSQIKIWAGMPVNSQTNQPYPAGRLTSNPIENPILDTGTTNALATYNRSAAVTINPATDDSGGVYTIVFFNKSNTTTKSTAAFAASGGTADTWIYAVAQKDYIITASVGAVSVSAYVRQVPGFTEPPAVVSLGNNTFSYTFAANNVSFVGNGVYIENLASP